MRQRLIFYKLLIQHTAVLAQAPKFPNASNLSFMFRYSKLSGISKFQKFALLTLKKMAKGGIFDQIGGGFHRYSTDARWLVPHFEKMLYDNALLPIVYSEAYQITKDPFFENVVKKTLDYVIREMTSSDGTFFLHRMQTLTVRRVKHSYGKNRKLKILGKDSEIFCIYYDVTDGGNFEGNTILANNINASSLGFKFGMTEPEIENLISKCSEKLLEIRNKREQPGKDDKIITSWNGLMVSAFLSGYRITDDSKYLDAAKQSIDFFESNFEKNHILHRTFKNAEPKLNGYLDDYAYMANASVDMFENTSQPKYLLFATNLANYLITHFWDDSTSGFFFTSDDHEKLIMRPKNNYDLSMPSGNSVAAYVLLKLYHITQNKQFLEIAKKIIESQAISAAENPFAFGYLLNALYLYYQKPTEITIINGKNSELVSSLRKKFLPESIMVLVESQNNLETLSKHSFFSGKEFQNDKTIVFVCKKL